MKTSLKTLGSVLASRCFGTINTLTINNDSVQIWPASSSNRDLIESLMRGYGLTGDILFTIKDDAIVLQ